MFQVGLLLKWIQHPINTLHLISITILILNAWNPLLIFDIGAQLSVAATIGILKITSKIENYLKKEFIII